MTVYVNGVNTSAEAHCSTLRWIAKDVLGDPGPILGVYNATQGFAGDIWQVTWDRFSVGVEEKLADFGLGQLSSGHDNRAVTTLANIIIHTARRGHPLTVWAHSQGGAITSLAFYRARRRTSPMRRPAP